MKKQRLKRIVFWLIFLVSSYAIGKVVPQGEPGLSNRWDPFEHPHWKVKCGLDSTMIEFSFDSISGDAAEDDMKVLIEVNKKAIPAKLESDLYQALPMPKNFKSLCDLVPGISPAPNQLLVLIGRNGRPSFDHLLGILIDVKNKNILQINNNLGAFTMVDNTGRVFPNLKIETLKNGFRVLGVQGNRPEARSDGPDAFIFGWQQILAEDGKIVSRWENPDLVKPRLKKSTPRDLSVCRKECESMQRKNQLKSGISLEACTKSICSK